MSSDNGKNAYELAATKRPVKPNNKRGSPQDAFTAEKPAKKPDSKPVKKFINWEKAARLYYRDHKTLQDALQAAGVSKGNSVRGRNYLARRSKPFRDAFGAEASRALKEAQVLGQQLSNEDLRLIVRGRLAQISARGEGTAKGATQATTQLGKLTGVEAFQPEGGGINVFGLVVPPELAKHYSENAEPPTIEVHGGREYIVTPPARSIGDPLPKPGEPPTLEAKTVRPQLSLEEDIAEIKVAGIDSQIEALRQELPSAPLRHDSTLRPTLYAGGWAPSQRCGCRGCVEAEIRILTDRRRFLAEGAS